MNDVLYDVVVVGAGPAGMVASLYAARYRLHLALIEKMSCGGQIILSPAIDNFPGFPGGIATVELIERFKKQIDELGVQIEPGEVTQIASVPTGKEPLYTVETQEKTFRAKSVIIASGAKSKRLGAKGEEKLIGRGVSYCGTCDAPLFRGKDVVVVGGGDRAVEEALFLTGYAKTVTLLHRRQALRASKILEEKAKASPKLKFILESVIEEITGDNKVSGLILKNVSSGTTRQFACDGVFIFVGIDPVTAFAGSILERDEAGFIPTDENMKTSREGIFACGDCRKKELYQVVNACAEGAVAAYSAHKYLLNQ